METTPVPPRRPPDAAFEAHPDPRSLFVGGDDPHWNAAGQALAARVVAAELAEWSELVGK